MKTARILALMLLVGLFGSSCATMSRLNSEFEEEQARVAQMSPQEKADFEEGENIRWDEYVGGGED